MLKGTEWGKMVWMVRPLGPWNIGTLLIYIEYSTKKETRIGIPLFWIKEKEREKEEYKLDKKAETNSLNKILSSY